MKNSLIISKYIILLLFILTSINNSKACGLRGTIYVDTSSCRIQGVATLRLVNHTTSPGTIYTWQQSNDGGLNWNTMLSNSGKDTQNINPNIIGRMYKCMSTCLSGSVFSDTLDVFFKNRSILVLNKICRPSIYDNDSLILILNTINQSGKLDTATAKNIMWQSSSTMGDFWSTLATSSNLLKVKFTSNIIQYRAFVSICPLTSLNKNSLPTSLPQLTNSINIGLTGLKLGIIQKDCVQDSITLSISNSLNSLKNQLIYQWKDTSMTSLSFGINSNIQNLKTKVDKNWRLYTASVKLCNTFNTSDSIKMSYNINPILHNFKSSLNCNTEKVRLDYSNRDSVRKDFFTYWKQSINNSNSFLPFNVPSDTSAYEFTLTNKTNNFYKVYSKLCPNSTTILDSTLSENVMLMIDTGLTKLSFAICPNDSITIDLLNGKASSSFPLYNRWIYKPYNSIEFVNYNLPQKSDSSLSFRMLKNWTSYRKSVSICPDLNAMHWSSSIAKTYLPAIVLDSIVCTGNMMVSVQDDTIRLKDFSGNYIKSNSNITFQWLKSTNNKLTSSIISGANNPSLSITQADRNSFFKRLTKQCPTSSTVDTSLWSNFVFGTPNAINGKAEIYDEMCLNDSVKICVSNFTPLAGNTPSYLWQISNDEITWTNLLNNSSNDSCIKALVEPTYQYYRRLTYWCPSGIIDSTASTPLIYVQNLPYCEGFTNQVVLGQNVLFNCWRQSNPVCSSYTPSFNGGKMWSQNSTGKTTIGISNWGPAPIDPKLNPRRLDLKLITPAFHLKKGKIYRFSFWNRADTTNNCWDSLYVTWGNTSNPCAITNKFGDNLTNFSFDQYNKFISDFIAPADGIYYFGINIREKDLTTGQIDFDDVCLKEIESCQGKSPMAGQTFAPNRMNHRSEEPSATTNFDKVNVTHQYCIHDTIMLTYNETNYNSNFDYYGMTYQFYKKRLDEDWNTTDTFFKLDTFYTSNGATIPYGKSNCHLNNRNNYHVKNIVVTDTNTWYKIVATCSFDNQEFHADSLLIQGTHAVPYCEDWEIGNIINNTPPTSNLPLGNSVQIVGKTPSFTGCPGCWSAYPQAKISPGPVAQDLTLHSVTLPFRNPPSGLPAIPQLEPDQGWAGNNVVINCDNRSPGLTREVLVMPAVRLYKGRAYRISFRWADNRTSIQAPWGSINQKLDSIYLMTVKGNQSGKTMDSFNKTKLIPGSLKLNIQSNINAKGSSKYQTYWIDYMPQDTGTYYFGVAIVAGATNGNAYRFVMDYFCIDTLSVDINCNDIPKFKDPLRIRLAPDGDVWSPGDTIFKGIHPQWCMGNKMNIELDFGNGTQNSWSYGWKMLWQRNTNEFIPNWTTISTFNPGISFNNGISFDLSYAYQDYRLVIANACNTLFDTIGPFKVRAKGGFPYYENFDESPGALPGCWEVYPSCRVEVKSEIPNNYYNQAKSHTEYLKMDYESPAQSCAMPITETAVAPGMGVTGGVTHRFSFWYKDNGISQPIDSIKMAWSGIRATESAPNTLKNIIGNDIVKFSKTNKWRYYTAEYTPSKDTTIHVKVTSFNLNNKRIYKVMLDNFVFKYKKNVDALVIAIDSPDYACGMTSNMTLKLSVMNIGFNSIVDMPVRISIDKGLPITAIIPGTTFPNQVRTIYIPNVDLSLPNTHNIKAWTQVIGEEDPRDDTFDTDILNNELYPKPMDTIDSACICSPYLYNGISPNGMAKWYKNINDFSPIFIGDHLRLDSICKDTSLYRASWNGSICYTFPNNTSIGQPTYVSSPGGLSFENTSLDTILIDSVLVYASSISISSFNINVVQFQGVNQIPIGSSFTKNGSLFISKLGRQWLPVKVKIPPGTDYKILYSGGGAALATYPGHIFFDNGCTSLNLLITGDDGYPSAANAYKYFFNWKLIKQGCESDRTKLKIKVNPKPNFKLKDTSRVCSQPVYNICAPLAPSGSSYSYQWNTAAADTFPCVSAKISQKYKLTVTNEYNCSHIDSLNVIVDQSPSFSLGPDTSFCKYSPYTIYSGLNSANNIVTWSDNQSGVNINILNPGTYIATAFNTSNFCSTKDTINISRRELPTFSLGADRVFCGQNIDLISEAQYLPSLIYSWKNNSSIVSSPGYNKWWVEGKDQYGCVNSDTIIANLVSKPIFDLGNDVSHCGSNYVIQGPIGNYYYLWNTTSTSKDINVAAPGTYYLTMTDSIFGCTSFDSIKISFKQVPVFDLGPTISICAANYELKGPTGDFKYLWQNSRRATIGSNPNYIVNTSGVYYLVINNYCYTYIDSVKVILKSPAINTIDMLKDTSNCSEAILRVSSKNDYSKIQWGYPLTDTSNILVAKQSGTYSVSLTNECGTATKSVQVRIDTMPIANFAVKEYPDCMSVALTNLSIHGVNYTWQFGDNSSSIIEHPIHNYKIEGEYLVSLVAKNKCGINTKTLPIARRIQGCNSHIFPDNLTDCQVYIYPNPAKSSTQILGLGLPNGKYTISIVNILGQSVLEKSIQINKSEIDEKIDLVKFSSGEYLIKISNEQESIVRKLHVIK